MATEGKRAYNQKNKERLRKYQREYMRTRRGSQRASLLPQQPIVCPICESIPNKFYWHHWDEEHPLIGMWVCPYCNIIVELEDKGLVETYRQEKERVCHYQKLKTEKESNTISNLIPA